MKAIVIVLLIVLAGCQTSQPARPPIPPDPGQACVTNLAYRSEFSILADKLALAKSSQQTFGMLSNTSKPNATEKTAIAEWAKAKQGCYDMSREWQNQYKMPLTLRAVQDTSFSSFLNLTADLYNGKLTYGEYAKARAKNAAQSNQQWAEAIQRLREQEQQAAADEQRRQQRAAQPYTPVVPHQTPMPRTTTTDCSVIGNQMHCTTQQGSIFDRLNLPRPPLDPRIMDK